MANELNTLTPKQKDFLIAALQLAGPQGTDELSLVEAGQNIGADHVEASDIAEVLQRLGWIGINTSNGFGMRFTGVGREAARQADAEKHSSRRFVTHPKDIPTKKDVAEMEEMLQLINDQKSRESDKVAFLKHGVALLDFAWRRISQQCADVKKVAPVTHKLHHEEHARTLPNVAKLAALRVNFPDIEESTIDAVFREAKRYAYVIDRPGGWELTEPAIAFLAFHRKQAEQEELLHGHPGGVPTAPNNSEGQGPINTAGVMKKKMEEESRNTPESEMPREYSAQWSILQAAIKKVPFLKYAMGIAGIAAAASISLLFFAGKWQYALWGTLAVFVGMILLKIISETKISIGKETKIQVQTIIWTVTIAFVAMSLVGVFVACRSLLRQ